MPRPPGAPRDFRIDFFRGIALYMILVDHLDANPLAKLTYHRFGYSDAAEIFVLLSGVSCGIAYYQIQVDRGPIALMKALLKRAGLIYVFYAAASLVTILLVAFCTRLLAPSVVFDGCSASCADGVLGASLSAIFLGDQVPFPGILVLYMALTILVGPLLFAARQYGVAPTLALSGSAWAITQFHPPAVGHVFMFPYFNPIAWQFLFAIGLFVGVQYRAPGRLAWTPPHWLLASAAVVVLAGLLAHLPSVRKRS